MAITVINQVRHKGSDTVDHATERDAKGPLVVSSRQRPGSSDRSLHPRIQTYHVDAPEFVDRGFKQCAVLIFIGDIGSHAYGGCAEFGYLIQSLLESAVVNVRHD